MTGLVQTSSEETSPRSCSPLIVSRDSFGPWTWACFQTGGAYPTMADVFICFWYTVYITLHVCVIIILAPSLWLPVGLYKEKKEEIWLIPMTKAHTPTEMSKGQGDNKNNATKKFDYTAVADRLRTFSWRNYGHPTGVVNLVYGLNLPTPRNCRVIKWTHV